MDFNPAIKTDNCSSPIKYYNNEKGLNIDTDQDVGLTQCVNTKIEKARNVILDFSKRCSLAYPEIKTVENCFVINPWCITIHKCNSSEIEIDKKHNVVEVACVCHELRKIVFTGCPYIATTPYVLVKKGAFFTGDVINGDIKFEDQTQKYSWELNHLHRLTETALLDSAESLFFQKKFTISFAFVKAAAERGSVAGRALLSYYYLKGYGVEQDLSKGVALLKELAAQNHAISEYNLGLCYERGTGVEKNQELSNYWYSRAAEHGYTGVLA